MPAEAHAPPHPEKLEPDAAPAVRVTAVNAGTWSEQFVDPAPAPSEQAVDPLRDTLPAPAPPSARRRVNVRVANVAPTFRACDIVRVHVVEVDGVPAQSPDQPAKTLLESGVAVIVAVAPAG